MTDKYIKFILTVIAGLLGILVLHGALKVPEEVPEAQARQPLECKIANELPIPVVVGNGPMGCWSMDRSLHRLHQIYRAPSTSVS